MEARRREDIAVNPPRILTIENLQQRKASMLHHITREELVVQVLTWLKAHVNIFPSRLPAHLTFNPFLCC